MTRARIRLNVVLFAMMLREFLQGPCSATDISTVTGIRRFTTLKQLRAMHAQGTLHIVEWEQDAAGRWRTPIYALGEGEDVPKPRPMTRTEKYAKAKQRLVARAWA